MTCNGHSARRRKRPPEGRPLSLSATVPLSINEVITCRLRESVRVVPQIRWRSWLALAAKLALLVFVFARPARALPERNTITVGEAFESENASGHFQMQLVPPGGKGSVNVADLDDSLFTDAHNPNLNLGFHDGTVWVRFGLHVESASIEPLFLIFHYASLDHLSLILHQPDGTVFTAESGDRLPLSLRPVKTHELGFRFIPQKGDAVAYVRVRTESATRMLSTLYTATSYVEAEAHERTLLGIFAGFGLLIVLYNLFVFASTGDANFLRYVLLIAFYVTGDLAIRGFASFYLYPEHPAFANVFIPNAIFPTMSVGLWFSIRFLSPRSGAAGLYSEFPRLYQAGKLTAFVLLLAPLSHVFGGYRVAASLATAALPIWSIYLITIGALLSRHGFRPAKFFLIAWSAFLFGIATTSLMTRGALPQNGFTNYAAIVGACCQMVLLSFGLADRINFLQVEVARQEKLTHQATLQALAEQERMNILKDDFLANTSHELRTPLNGIIGLAEMLEEEPQFDGRAKGNLRMIASSGRRLASLVNDILDFSKLKKNELILQRTRTDLAPIVTTVIGLASTMVGKKALTVTSLVSSQLQPVYGDANRVQQILLNLVGNAIKFTESGAVTIEAFEGENTVTITVTDTGIGISPQAIGRIFESFEQGDGSTARKYGGTGLGLAVTRQLVAAHGGEISVESEIGKGSRFVVVLPSSNLNPESVSMPAATALQSPAPTKPLVGAKLPSFAPPARAASVDSQRANSERPPSLVLRSVPDQALGAAAPPEAAEGATKGHVLVVDDEYINRELLVQLLTQRGYSVDTADDGIEAVEKMANGTLPDIVLLDVMMPGKSGYEVLSDVRKTHNKEMLPILLLTAKTQERDLAEGFKWGANDYITKPFSRIELEARVAHHLTVTRQTRRLATELAERIRLQGTNEHLLLENASARTNLDAIARERQALAAELDEATKQLVQAEKMASLGQQVSGIAHEIGNPLNYISGSAQLMNLECMDLEEKCPGEAVQVHFERLREHLNDVETGCEKIREISQAMRNYSRLDDVATPDTNLHEVAREALVILEGKAQGIRLTLSASKASPITCHRSHVGQVIMNLVGNAIDALHERREAQGFESCGQVQIELHDADSGGVAGIELCVDDDGGGVPKAIRSKILEPFFTTKPAGKGTGLGLAITSKIVHQHGGRISIETSADLGGASFRVWFPSVPPSHAAQNPSGLNAMFDD